MHSLGKIFWDRIYHHFKCKTTQNPTKDYRTIYKTIASLNKGNTFDGETDLQDVEEMDEEDDEEEEDEDDGKEEDENEEDKDDKYGRRMRRRTMRTNPRWITVTLITKLIGIIWYD